MAQENVFQVDMPDWVWWQAAPTLWVAKGGGYGFLCYVGANLSWQWSIILILNDNTCSTVAWSVQLEPEGYPSFDNAKYACEQCYQREIYKEPQC